MTRKEIRLYEEVTGWSFILFIDITYLIYPPSLLAIEVNQIPNSIDAIVVEVNSL